MGPAAVCPRQDSNLRHRLRRAVLYPLSYGGQCWARPVHAVAPRNRIRLSHRGPDPARLLDPPVRCPPGPYCQMACPGVLGLFLNAAFRQLPGYSGVVPGLSRSALMKALIRGSVGELTKSW